MPQYITAEELGLDLNKLPKSSAEAEERFEIWRSNDPFPEIDPALLNSADLFDYIATTGMIYPLEVNPLKVDLTLKPASCGIHLGGKCIYWTYESKNLTEEVLTVGKDSVLELPRNSIVYAQLAPRFRLPDYIAARFNLSIKYVYRGLLVGTGPLVDPGFDGLLQIPLHNLTSTPCQIPVSDVILWMEFTKVSSNAKWVGEGGNSRYGRYVHFPERKRSERASLKAYLEHANDGRPIISSIPELVERAANEAQRTRRSARRFQIGTIIGTVVAIGAAIIALLSYVNDVQDNITSHADTALQRSNRVEAGLNQLKNELDNVAKGGVNSQGNQ